VGALALPAAAPAQQRVPPPVETFDFTSNLHPLGYSPQGNTPNLPGQTFTANSDLAFQGNYAFQGHYEGFRIINIASSANPREVSFTDCNGNQGDLVVYGDILVRSWNSPAPAGATCDGQAVPTGFEGLHIFDISDLRDPRRLHAKGFGDYASSAAEHDHHAFTWWAPAKLLVVPMYAYDPRSEDDFMGAVGVRVDRGGLTEAGRTEHPEQDGVQAEVHRSVVVGDHLYTISSMGIQAGRLDTLAGTAWLPFPTSSR
jgi:hypothetical protein